MRYFCRRCWLVLVPGPMDTVHMGRPRCIVHGDLLRLMATDDLIVLPNRPTLDTGAWRFRSAELVVGYPERYPVIQLPWDGPDHVGWFRRAFNWLWLKTAGRRSGQPVRDDGSRPLEERT